MSACYVVEFSVSTVTMEVGVYKIGLDGVKTIKVKGTELCVLILLIKKIQEK